VVSKPLDALIPSGGETEPEISQLDQSSSTFWFLNQCGSATSSVYHLISDGAMTVSDGALKVVSKPLNAVISSSGESESEISQLDQGSSAYWLFNHCGSATSSLCQVISNGAVMVSDGALQVVSMPLSAVMPVSNESKFDVLQLDEVSNSSVATCLNSTGTREIDYCCSHHDSKIDDMFSWALSTELDARHSSYVLHNDLNDKGSYEEEDPDEPLFKLDTLSSVPSCEASEQELSSEAMPNGRPDHGSDVLVASLINSTALAGIVCLVIVS